MPVCLIIEMAEETKRLILASASSRRQHLLTSVGLDFDVLATSINEKRLQGERVQEYLRRVTRLKMDATIARLTDLSNKVVLTADTVVTKKEEIFHKPTNLDDAIRIWKALSNTEHQVITALCMRCGDNIECTLTTTTVLFTRIDDDQMYSYWRTGEPLDKAGAYALQGLASAWVKDIRGSYSNVVGLPLYETNQLLTKAGLNWL